MKNVSSEGPWKRVREDIDYEMNPSGLVRTIPTDTNSRVVYIKPSYSSGKQVRYQLYSNKGTSNQKRSSFTFRNLYRRVWDEDRTITRENVKTMKQIAERKNRENGVNQKPREEACKEDEPTTVNGKTRYCIFCGYQLYKSDANFFYHSACFRSRNEGTTNECFSGCHSFA